MVFARRDATRHCESRWFPCRNKRQTVKTLSFFVCFACLLSLAELVSVNLRERYINETKKKCAVVWRWNALTEHKIFVVRKLLEFERARAIKDETRSHPPPPELHTDAAFSLANRCWSRVCFVPILVFIQVALKLMKHKIVSCSVRVSFAHM